MATILQERSQQSNNTGNNKTKFLTSYFKYKTSTSRVHLPRGHQTMCNNMDNNKPIDGIQSTMH
eukprot:10173585-Ditylum_brightwellii.AAC.1